jgi:serine/threonine protein kinase
MMYVLTDEQVLAALSYLQKLGIAHRDIRSDNLLVNQEGVVKLADFSSAAKVPRAAPVRFDTVGVLYWQVRCCRYWDKIYVLNDLFPLV